MRNKYRNHCQVTEDKTKEKYKTKFKQAAHPILQENQELKTKLEMVQQLTNHQVRPPVTPRVPLTPSISDSIISTPTRSDGEARSRSRDKNPPPPVPNKPSAGLRVNHDIHTVTMVRQSWLSLHSPHSPRKNLF